MSAILLDIVYLGIGYVLGTAITGMVALAVLRAREPDGSRS